MFRRRWRGLFSCTAVAVDGVIRDRYPPEFWKAWRLPPMHCWLPQETIIFVEIDIAV
jgi:hypothetical protein